MYDHLDTMGEDLSVVGAGAPVGLARRAASMSFSRAVAARRPEWLGLASEQGVSLPAQELDVLPFDPVTLDVATSFATLFSFPQRPFRGERLIISAVYTPNGGSPVDGGNFANIAPAIYVGAVQVGATQGEIPCATFAATAFGVRLSFPTAGQGTRITIPVTSKIALAAGDTLKISATLIGRAVR